MDDIIGNSDLEELLSFFAPSLRESKTPDTFWGNNGIENSLQDSLPRGIDGLLVFKKDDKFWESLTFGMENACSVAFIFPNKFIFEF
jgi:hypothetical protein